MLDKAQPGAGASGIACGVVRNNYFQPAMSELMQACVEVWESDPVAYSYNSVGYMALGASVQEADLTATYERQERIGYDSELVVGADAVDAHMKALFPDWRAQGVTVCLHEHQGGFAFNMDSVRGLHDKCVSEGVQVVTGVEVTGFAEAGDGSIIAVETSEGPIEVGEQVVVAPGPWAKRFWKMLGLPDTIDVRTPSGDVIADRPMWTYWNLQEGEVEIDPLLFATADGSAPPVIHLDTDAPARHGRRAARHGRAVGDLLQARPPRSPGRGIAARRRRRRRARSVPADDGRRPDVPGHVVRRAFALDGALRGVPPAVQDRSVRRRRSVHRRQLPGLRLLPPEPVRDSRLEPRLQDDRRR